MKEGLIILNGDGFDPLSYDFYRRNTDIDICGFVSANIKQDIRFRYFNRMTLKEEDIHLPYIDLLNFFQEFPVVILNSFTNNEEFMSTVYEQTKHFAHVADPVVDRLAIIEMNAGLAQGVLVGPYSHIHHDVALKDLVVVREKCTIGSLTEIGEGSYICKGVTIGKNCKIGKNVFISENVTIKDFSEIKDFDKVY